MEEELRRAFADSGWEPDIRLLPPAEIAAAARELVAGGAETVGVAGGDGTVSTVAGELVNTAAALAVFPGGTLNHFALTLGIRSYEEAFAALRGGRAEAIDVGEVNGHVFVNGASLGLYPRQLRIRGKWEGRLGKWPAAALAALHVFRDFPRPRLHIEGPGLHRTAVAPVIWIGPGRGSFRAPSAAPRELHSGTLEVVVISAPSRLRLLRLMTRVVLHGGDGLSVARRGTDFTAYWEPEIVVSASGRRRLDLGVDGELDRLRTPLHFRIQQSALRVFLPSSPSPAEPR